MACVDLGGALYSTLPLASVTLVMIVGCDMRALVGQGAVGGSHLQRGDPVGETAQDDGGVAFK